MPPPHIRKRTRYFVGAEGESEQSLVKWIQELSEQQGLHIHLDCHPLGGGGYGTMLNTAVVYRKRGLTKGSYKASFLLVDGDRAVTGDLKMQKINGTGLISLNTFIGEKGKPSACLILAFYQMLLTMHALLFLSM